MPNCLRRLEHVGAKGPAVAAVVEGPVAARVVQERHAGLVVVIPAHYVQGFREPEMRITCVAPCEAAGAREKRRALGEGVAVCLRVLGGSNRVLAQRLIGQVVVHGNPAVLLGVLLSRGVDRASRRQSSRENPRRSLHWSLDNRDRTRRFPAVAGHRQKAEFSGQLHLPVSHGEVQDGFALLEPLESNCR